MKVEEPQTGGNGYHLAGPVTVHQGVGGNTKGSPPEDRVGRAVGQIHLLSGQAHVLLGSSQGTVKNSGSGSRQIGVRAQLHPGDQEKKLLPLSASFSISVQWRL